MSLVRRSPPTVAAPRSKIESKRRGRARALPRHAGQNLERLELVAKEVTAELAGQGAKLVERVGPGAGGHGGGGRAPQEGSPRGRDSRRSARRRPPGALPA